MFIYSVLSACCCSVFLPCTGAGPRAPPSRRCTRLPARAFYTHRQCEPRAAPVLLCFLSKYLRARRCNCARAQTQREASRGARQPEERAETGAELARRGDGARLPGDARVSVRHANIHTHTHTDGAQTRPSANSHGAQPLSLTYSGAKKA